MRVLLTFIAAALVAWAFGAWLIWDWSPGRWTSGQREAALWIFILVAGAGFGLQIALKQRSDRE